MSGRFPSTLAVYSYSVRFSRTCKIISCAHCGTCENQIVTFDHLSGIYEIFMQQKHEIFKEKITSEIILTHSVSCLWLWKWVRRKIPLTNRRWLGMNRFSTEHLHSKLRESPWLTHTHFCINFPFFRQNHHHAKTIFTVPTRAFITRSQIQTTTNFRPNIRVLKTTSEWFFKFF